MRFRRASSPLVHSGAGLAGLPAPHLPRRGVRNTGRFTAPAAPRAVKHVASCAFQAHDTVSCWNSTRQTAASDAGSACVPHATVLSACNSQRHHALGALTECLATPHCWVLGPPTSSAGRRPFTTLPPARLTARRRTKGPQTRRVRRIPLLRRRRSRRTSLAGAGRTKNNPGRRTKQELFFRVIRN